MAKSSLDYWREREQEANKNAIKDEAVYNKRIKEIYSYTERNIQRTINDFYARYASKEGITMNEARKRVREIDMRHYEQLARKYVRDHDFSAQANEEMALYNLTMKVNRLELLKAEINLELIAGYDDIEKEMRKDLLEQAMKVDARYAGILGKSAIGNQKYANQLVNASFMGATFSERLWGVNMPDLRAHLEVELRNGLIQGIHPRKLAQRFRKHYGGSVKDTERLMITEMRRLQTAVQAESFERNGFKEYLFITAGDERVCPECAKLHGQHFKISEMQVGENAPPMHPNCHCSTTAYMDSKKYKDWIDALANGEDVRWDEFQSGEYEKRKAETLTERRKQRLAERRNQQSAGETKKQEIPEIKYDNRVSEKQVDVIKALVDEYQTRLREVTVGANKAAGDVDISGARMRLSSKSLDTAMHEFAHSMANTRADKFGLTDDQEFWKEIKKIRREYHRDVDKDSDTRRYISTYEHASRSVDEFMADAFAHAKMKELGINAPDKYGKDYTYSIRVLETIDKYFKRRK